MNQVQFYYPIMKIGIIGGGQLGKMMAIKAKKMGFYITILDPAHNCPASQIADEIIVGDFYEKNKLTELVKKSDVTTYDIEHIDTNTLKELVNEGHKILPSPYLLEIIQDKFKQKDTLSKNGIPVPEYEKLEKFDEIQIEKFGFPCVQKLSKGGYDGKGVNILRTKNDLNKAFRSESILERFVEIEKELAIMVARNSNGEIKVYPVVEMIFHKNYSICDMVIAPAKIEENIKDRAIEIAVKSVEALNGAGIFGVEMFLTKDQKVLVNEIAPRPHNSGHYTIEACTTCQFEQHIRAITNLPLGSTDLLANAVMLNLLGEEGYEGEPVIEGLQKALQVNGLSFHYYGKALTKPFRKMGHITILHKNLMNAIEKAEEVKEYLKIKAKVRK